MGDTRVVKVGNRMESEPIPRWVGSATCPVCRAQVEIGEEWQELGRVYPRDLDAYERALETGGSVDNTLVIVCPSCLGATIPAVAVSRAGRAYRRALERRNAEPFSWRMVGSIAREEPAAIVTVALAFSLLGAVLTGSLIPLVMAALALVLAVGMTLVMVRERTTGRRVR